jgi:hypothetical protein
LKYLLAVLTATNVSFATVLTIGVFEPKPVVVSALYYNSDPAFRVAGCPPPAPCCWRSASTSGSRLRGCGGGGHDGDLLRQCQVQGITRSHLAAALLAQPGESTAALTRLSSEETERAVMNDRERQLWTKYVRDLEARKNAKPARKRRARKPEPTPDELEQALDDLVRLDSRGNTLTNT